MRSPSKYSQSPAKSSPIKSEDFERLRMVKVDEDYDKQLRIALDLTVVEESPLRDRRALDVGVSSSVEHKVSL